LVNFKSIFVAEPAIESGHHFGCRLGTMPDGTIVATLGERGDRKNAQDPTKHPGSIIRLNPNGSPPADNPYSDESYADRRDWLPELFSIGNRNPQGLAIHPTTGELWTHEHGPKGGDEINIVRGGENFGWPIVSHGQEYSGGKISDDVSAPSLTDSVHHWTPSIAPSGMAFYTGTLFPGLTGSLLVGSLKFRLLMVVRLDGNRVISEHELLRDQIGRIRDVAVGHDGAIYLLTDEGHGGVWRLRPQAL
jgi:glucose/arabinose dehydrogenase